MLMDGKKESHSNIKLEGPMHALDDLGAIEGLRLQTSAAFQGGKQIDAVTRALLLNWRSSILKLTAWLMKTQSSTTCVGCIICNLDLGTDVHHLIMSLAGGEAEFFVQGVVVPLQRKSVDYRSKRFQQSVQLNVCDLDAEFPIALRVSGLGFDSLSLAFYGRTVETELRMFPFLEYQVEHCGKQNGCGLLRRDDDTLPCTPNFSTDLTNITLFSEKTAENTSLIPLQSTYVFVTVIIISAIMMCLFAALQR